MPALSNYQKKMKAQGKVNVKAIENADSTHQKAMEVVKEIRFETFNNRFQDEYVQDNIVPSQRRKTRLRPDGTGAISRCECHLY